MSSELFSSLLPPAPSGGRPRGEPAGERGAGRDKARQGAVPGVEVRQRGAVAAL